MCTRTCTVYYLTALMKIITYNFSKELFVYIHIKVFSKNLAYMRKLTIKLELSFNLKYNKLNLI